MRGGEADDVYIVERRALSKGARLMKAKDIVTVRYQKQCWNESKGSRAPG